MKQNQKLMFTKKASRPCLSRDEANYWKRLLESTLKVGLEHELNLRTTRGTCSGQSFLCPCSHPDKEITKCYTKCKIYNVCSLRNKYECPGIYCVEFVSPCPTCTSAVKDCTKCTMFANNHPSPNTVRGNISSELTPSNNLLNIGKHGVFQIVKDGSLEGDGGIEVTTVGRRVSYESLFEQTKSIIDSCIEYRAFVNERTSIHIHLLAGYYNLVATGGKIQPVYVKGQSTKQNITELEKPLPEIVLSNFHQLIRKYHNALVWITSSGNKKEAITRWVKFRLPILSFSALRRDMKSIIEEIAEKDGHNGKYSFINYSNVGFDENINISKLHIEARFCDGSLSPSAITSFAILLYAIMLKAISLSVYGIMHSGDKAYMDEATKIQTNLLNNNGNYDGPRHSDTKNFEPYAEKVRLQAKELVNFLKPELRPHGKALSILLDLAEEPCSYRLCKGHTWEQIENDLSNNATQIPGAILNKVTETIDTMLIEECLDEAEWLSAAVGLVGAKEASIIKCLTYLKEQNHIFWDKETGTYVRS